MKQANKEIRAAARAAKIPLWRIADAIDISEAMMTRKLRRELPEDEKAKILAAIKELEAAADD